MLDKKARSEIYHENTKRADCSVVAAAAVSGLPYDEAEALLLETGYQVGEHTGAGAPRGTIERALRSVGFKMESEWAEPGTTVATFWMTHRSRSTYLIYTDGHVCSLVNGKPYNFGTGYALVESVTRVTRKETT